MLMGRDDSFPSIDDVGTAPIVVLEGVDGAGKSSQARAVAASLRSRGLLVAEPTRDPDRRIRKTYKRLIAEADRFPSARTSVFLGLSDYADALHSSDAVPCDIRLFERYCYSAIADGIALGLPRGDATSLTRFFPAPSITIFIDLRAEEALARKGSCTLAEAGGPDHAQHYPSLEASFVAYQEKVRAAYRHLGRVGAIANLCIVDGATGFDQVTASILEQIDVSLFLMSYPG
jgi:dTMP kinase